MSENESVLKGIKVIEIGGLAPGPFCGMILSDFGATVTRIDRPSANNFDRLTRGKKSISIDFKSKDGIALILQLASKSDVFIDPFRPGAAESIGIGPDVLMKLNPRLIYVRLTGYGQTGPMAKSAGHDINYIALSGALSPMARKGQPPMFPTNLLGDFAGGGLMAAFATVMALFERTKSGKGQVIDVAMMDGAAYINTFVASFYGEGLWSAERGTNMLDSGAHFYDVYETKDGKYLSVGAIEPQFYKLLIKGMGLENEKLPSQNDSSKWPEMKEKFKNVFLSKTRDEWSEIFGSSDACVAPVIHLDELDKHPQAIARKIYSPNEEGIIMPNPAPKLSRTPGKAQQFSAILMPGQHSLQILKEFGFSDQAAKDLCDRKIVKQIELPKASL
eukprot:TRINITY_DN3494_c0_g2_i1.p1 TRINITY_DN3494_c0_g2~~TRINITY_DN3494_c0_g2_i1.p1  ORF type:complete len:389 (-),score=164.62 TRINITY_DN3494_c0_g2_i1:82-1248(-)